MTKPRIEPVADNRIAVYSPYTPQFVSAARATGGQWDASIKAWIFPAEATKRVRELLRQIYGTDDQTSAKAVRLRITVPDIYTPERRMWQGMDESNKPLSIFIGGREIAWAYHRDSGAKIGADIIVLSGGFTSGGSRKNPCCSVKDGTVFDILRLAEPKALELVAEFPEICQIVTDDGDDVSTPVDTDNVVQLRGA